MRYRTLRFPPYRMFAIVCILLVIVVMNHYYSDISLLYASNIFMHAEAPRLQNLCHRLASSTMAFNYDQRRYLWHNF